MEKPCMKCDKTTFKQDVRQQANVTYYYTVCENCGYEILNGYYVSTINECEDGACKV